MADTTSILSSDQYLKKDIDSKTVQCFTNASLSGNILVDDEASYVKKIDVHLDGTLPAGTYYILVVSQTTALSAGVIPGTVLTRKIVITDGTAQDVAINFADMIVSCGGLVVALSSTGSTMTVVGNHMLVNVMYS